MDEVIFTPKYTFRYNMSLVFLPILTLFLLYLSVIEVDWIVGTFAAMLALATVFLLSQRFRQIRFGELVVIEKWLGRNWILEYDDIKDVGNTAILINNKKSSVPISHIRNVDDLFGIVERLTAEGRWKESPITGKLLNSERSARKSFLIGMGIVFLVVLIAILLGQYPANLDARLVYLIVGIPLSLLLYMILVRRNKQ